MSFCSFCEGLLQILWKHNFVYLCKSHLVNAFKTHKFCTFDSSKHGLLSVNTVFQKHDKTKISLCSCLKNMKKHKKQKMFTFLIFLLFFVKTQLKTSKQNCKMCDLRVFRMPLNGVKALKSPLKYVYLRPRRPSWARSRIWREVEKIVSKMS